MGGKININAEQVLIVCFIWLILTIIIEVNKTRRMEKKHGLNKRKSYHNNKR